MHARLTALRTDERGFTLVEMMVAILLLAIIFTAMVSVIITSLTAMQRDEQRVRATQLVQEELERLRAIEWDCAAFDASDPDYVSTYNGNETVSLDPAECSDPTISPDPSARVRTVDGIDYTVVPHVYWMDDPEDGTDAAGTDTDPQDYKEFAVEVTWTLRGQTYTYANTTTRAPTIVEVPLEMATTSGFEITSLVVDPTSVTTSGGATTTAVLVTVETSEPATLVQLTVAAPSSFATTSLTDISAGAGRRWRLTIPAGSTAFPNGDHEFVITATSTLGSDTAAQTVTFAEAPAVTPVTINAPLLSPAAPICVANSKKAHQSVTVTVDIDGVSASDEVDLSWTDRSGSAPVSYIASTATGARFTATIPASTTFNSSTTTLTIDARRVSDNTVAQGTFTVNVVQHNDGDDCP